MKVLDQIREHARTRPEDPAIIEMDADGKPVRTGYAELVAAMEAHAERFLAAGARPGDRCGLLAPQGRGFIEAALGLLAADLCMVPIPDDTGADALVRFRKNAALDCLVDRRSAFELERFSDVVRPEGLDDAAFRALRPAYLRFTSGTTHARKGVVLGQETIAARLEAANRGLAIGPEDRILWLLPMAHHFVVSILLYLRFGATLLLPRSSLAAPVLDLAHAAGATVCYASPYHYTLLGKDPSERPFGALRIAVSTATGLKADVAERFRVRFGLPIVQALGIIEVGLPVMNLRHAEEKPEALGAPLPDFEIWLRGDDGTPLPEAQPGSPTASGEVCIRGPGLLDAYLSPFQTVADGLLAEGFRTGDQGWFDEDGDLHLVGRRHNRISMAGMKFFAEEVEAVLDTHPAIARSRVRAERHAQLGELPVAEVVLAEGHAAPKKKDLVGHCRAQLPSYQIPRRFDVLDALPLTPTGKVRRWEPDSAPEPAEPSK